MNTAIQKLCSRCKAKIQCNAASISQCHCSKVNLTKDTLEFLQKTEYDCLCNQCLLAVEKLVIEAYAQSNKLTENTHYYLENGLLVFTELYHIQRGYCCNSGCRHCAYGYKSES